MRREVGSVGAVVGEAGGADARVAAGEDYRDAAAAELGVEVADGAGVGDGDSLLVLLVWLREVRD